MKKFNKKRRIGAQKNAQARWQGVGKILALCSRAEHTENVESVVAGFYATDLIVNTKNI